MTSGAPASRRRRAALLAALALASGGFAAVEVERRSARADAVLGPPARVVVATRDVPAGASIDPALAAEAFEARAVPARFVPPDALADPAEAVGLRLASALEPGSYLTAGALRIPRPRRVRTGPRRGERAVEIAVAGGEALVADGRRPPRVDVLVTTDARGGDGRTFLALEDVELLAARPGGGPAGSAEAGAAAPSGTLATLRVTLRQAVFLTAAQAYAREVRLLARPPGDRRRVRAPLSAGRGLSGR